VARPATEKLAVPAAPCSRNFFQSVTLFAANSRLSDQRAAGLWLSPRDKAEIENSGLREAETCEIKKRDVNVENGMVNTTQPERAKLWLVALSLILCGVRPARAGESFNFVSIDLPGAVATFAFGINPEADIVGRYHADGNNHGFLLSEGAFTTMDFPSAVASCNWGIDPRGDIVGFYESADGSFHGYLATPTRR
jgi:hypothetical protein